MKNRTLEKFPLGDQAKETLAQIRNQFPSRAVKLGQMSIPVKIVSKEELQKLYPKKDK